jgi:glycine/D-amino acid oxidase-like deaminating enzyme
MSGTAIVIGAGVLGSSTAFRLARQGWAVTVLEAGRVGGGTSSCSFAWLNSSNKTPQSYHELNVAGMRAHADLAALFPDAPWLHRGGGIEIASGPEEGAELTARTERLRGWGYASALITASELAALEPDIDLTAIPEPTIAYSPEEGWLDPVLFAASMIRAARGLGAQIRTETPVAGLHVVAGHVRGVVTRAGERIEADAVVNCAGRWCNEASGDATLHIPLAPTVGLLVFTPPAPVTLGRVVRTPLVDARPDGAGRLMLHDNALDVTVDLATLPAREMAQAETMVRGASRLLPAITGIRPEAARITARPIPGDGYSAIGWVPGVDGYYLAVTHSAVTMSAHLGALVAGEVSGGPPDAALAPFRPARFFSGNAGGPPIGGGAEAFTRAG